MQILSYISDFISFSISNHPIRTLLDLILISFILYIIFKKPYNPNKDKDKPTEQEIDELCNEWQPDPLVPDDVSLTEESKYTDSGPGPTIVVDGKTLLNFSTFNFLGLSNDKKIISECKKVIDHYGVGSCGPRGFYGSQKTHIDLERRAFEFFKFDDCVLYSYGFATVSSVIPAFLKRNDLIFVDEKCSYPIQYGCELSRSKVFRYRHNDMDDLERLLKDATTGTMKKLATKQRRYIITQGVFENTGDITPVKRIIELKKKYKMRLILDDSFGVGVLGATGRGTVEHSGCEMADIDIFVANLENALGGVGGICLGSAQIVRHQRLMGLAFTFSASLPPYTSAASILAFNEIENSTARIDKLRENSHLLYTTLSNLHPYLRVEATPGVCLFHVRLTSPHDNTVVRTILEEISNKCFEKGLAVVVPKYSSKEWIEVEPSIRLTVTAEHTEEQIRNAAQILRESSAEVLNNRW